MSILYIFSNDHSHNDHSLNEPKAFETLKKSCFCKVMLFKMYAADIHIHKLIFPQGKTKQNKKKQAGLRDGQAATPCTFTKVKIHPDLDPKGSSHCRSRPSILRDPSANLMSPLLYRVPQTAGNQSAPAAPPSDHVAVMKNSLLFWNPLAARVNRPGPQARLSCVRSKAK